MVKIKLLFVSKAHTVWLAFHKQYKKNNKNSNEYFSDVHEINFSENIFTSFLHPLSMLQCD